MWSVRQSKSAAADAATLAVTFTGNVASGSKIIAVTASYINTISTVKDAALNSWTKLASRAWSDGNGGELALWGLDVPAGDAGTAPTLTATGGAGVTAIAILVQEVAGRLPGNTTAMLDGAAASLAGTASGSTGSPSYSSAVASEYLVSVYGDDENAISTWTAPGSPWTADANGQNASNIENVEISYKDSTGGAESGAYSTSPGTSGWAVIMVAFQLAPPAAAMAAQPGRTWLRRFHHKQVLPPAPVTAAAAAPAGTVVFAAPNRRPGPHRAALGARGALAAGILAAGIGPPPVPAPHQPPAITHPAPHRASWRSGRGAPPNAAQQVKAPVPVTVYSRKPHGVTWRGGRGVPPAAAPQPFHPATVFTRGAHRVLWRGGSGPAPAAVQGGGAPQPFTPKTVYSRKPHGVTWKAGAGQPPAAARQPFKPVTVFTRAAHRAAWRGIAGPAPVVVQGGGTLQPTRPVTVYVRKAHAAIWRAVTGRPPAAARQPFRPVTVYARKPHRVTWRSGLGSPAAPPPPFTIGALTAADTASGVLTAAGSSSALTAATAAQGTLTATDQRTGGPG